MSNFYKIEIDKSEKKILSVALYALINDEKRIIKENGKAIFDDKRKTFGVYDREDFIKKCRKLRNFLISLK